MAWCANLEDITLRRANTKFRLHGHNITARPCCGHPRTRRQYPLGSSWAETEGRGRTVDEWKIKPEHFDNHFLDGLVGCAVGASMQGVALPGMKVKTAPKKQRVRLSDIRRSKM